MAKFVVNEEKAKREMASMGWSYDEAVAVQLADWEEEHGIGHDYDLSPEEHKKAMKYANVGEKKAEGKTERKRKENPTKRAIIHDLATFLKEYEEFSFVSVEITNPERVVRFVLDEDVYEITLSQKRKPKN